ncbi:putative HAF family extracellular repeat protein [Edaphobacter aggregans]|uniref:Putative HAF family extracellular repeat protein n=1 Tax=Edaphobacter aggregans TaxID=570835 RepID=A0A3R9QBC8_9BACT|nr:hypothetical protein [Edaphobacter aggregans]RSL17681.1 putative HAF family extracellular repeat protein [Edaphobacter aggregans]
MSAFTSTKYSSILLFLILFACASQVIAQVYQITDLGTLPSQTSSSAVGINQLGQIAGSSGNHAFLYSNGTMTDLGFLPGSNQASASAINNSGQIVGTYGLTTLQGRTLGFLWDSGVISDPFNSAAYINGQFETQGFEPVAINDNGQVAVNLASNGNSTALLWQVSGNQITTLSSGGSTAYAINNVPQVSLVDRPSYAFGAIWSLSGTTVLPTLYPPLAGYGPTPYGINQNGQAVGESYANSQAQIHAFLWSNGTISDLGTLGGANSTARAINSTGQQIVGDSDQNPNTATTQNRRAFLYANANMLDLNSQVANILGWELQSAVGINDSGQIVGNGTYLGNAHAFLLTPIIQGTVSPIQGGNAGNVTLNVFYPGTMPTSVDLACAGGTTIVGGVPVPISSNFVQVTFNLTGVTPGACSVVLNEPGGSILTTPNAFTVVQGGAPDIRISVAGFPQLRAGLPETYYIVAENVGNVDSGSVRIWVSFPSFLQWQPAGVQPSSSGAMNGNTFVAFDILPKASSNNPIPFLLTAPVSSNLVHKPFQIQAWKLGQ